MPETDKWMVDIGIAMAGTINRIIQQHNGVLIEVMLILKTMLNNNKLPVPEKDYNWNQYPLVSLHTFLDSCR